MRAPRDTSTTLLPECCSAAYQAGFEQGIAEGRRQVEAEDAARWAVGRDRALAALAARDAGVVLPGVAS